MTQSPPVDWSQRFTQPTQEFTQSQKNATTFSSDVRDEEEEGVWGYLMPTDHRYGKRLVLRKRNACPLPDMNSDLGNPRKGKDLNKEEDAYEATKFKGIASGGYLIGRHPECGK